MWITLITVVLQLVNVTSAVVLNFTICAKGKADTSSTEKRAVNRRLRQEKKEETPKGEQNSDRADTDCSLGADNPQIRLVVAETAMRECTETYITNLETILETASNYIWGMKKHMAADEAAWRELAKRITLLHAEGYDVRAGTKEAKLRRLSTAKLQSDLMEKVTKKKRRKAEEAD